MRDRAERSDAPLESLSREEMISELRSSRAWRAEAEGLLREALVWVFEGSALAEQIRALLGEGSGNAAQGPRD